MKSNSIKKCVSYSSAIILAGLLATAAFDFHSVSIDTALAKPNSMVSSFLPARGTALPPHGLVSFCQNQPQHCAARSAPNADQPHKFSEKSWNELVEVNSVVNNTVIEITDWDLLGVEEYWTFPTAVAGSYYGDCEDFVLAKRQMLLNKGWSDNNLLMTVARLPDGTYHLVLTARTSNGDFILDNLSRDVLPWSMKEGYRWHSRQVSSLALKWERL